MNLMRSLDDYEQFLAPARERFAVSPGVRAIESTSDDVFLELFLLHFCALGSQMTEPVERWIRRAAERCVTVGFPELARALKGHAQAEAGHHLMMIADVRSLAARRFVRFNQVTSVAAVTSLCIGTSALGSPPQYGYEVSNERAVATMYRVFEGPINFIDTSNEYGNGGDSERRIDRPLQ
jgi:hypothetical protein